MKIETFTEILTAAHLSVHVQSPFPSRGGIMMVAPPASLKTSMINQLSAFPNAKVLSDINVQQLIKIRDDISTGTIRTLAFPELEKLYQRHDSTAANVEGTLKAMVEEGFRHAAFEPAAMRIREARCFVVGGMTHDVYMTRWNQWTADGFARRFLWCHFQLADPDLLYRAIDRWEPLVLTQNPLLFGLPSSMSIPYEVTKEQSGHIRRMLRFQPSPVTPFILMKKILSVLHWRYPIKQYKTKAWKILEDFAECLGERGADLQVPEPEVIRKPH